MISLNCPHKKLDQKGFTLLEIMISMAILTFISYGIFQAVTDSYRLRDTLSGEGDSSNQIQLATQILQRDISLLYSPTGGLSQKEVQPNKLLEPLIAAKLRVELQKRGLLQRYEFWSSALLINGIRPSHFVGTEKKMSFVTHSHIRLYQEAPESEFAQITYELQLDPASSLPILKKTENTDAFVLEPKSESSFKTYLLLPQVQLLKFTYYRREGDTLKPFPSWDSDLEETLNRYPEMISMEIEVIGFKKQVFHGLYYMRPEGYLNGILGSI